ncbi:MAG TPA: GNAT family N-acetyltransferase [Spirochaetia bacterium]|nr:GNAT family N-acetyltransferase [Spirochaetia bacterium]
MSDSIVIDTMRTDDAARVAELSSQLGYPTPTDEMRMRIASLAGIPHEGLLVARDGEVVGWIHVHHTTYLQSGKAAEVTGLVVQDTHRSKGIGAALLQAAESWAIAQGLGRLRVRSNIVRADAHRFYERAGYRRAKTSLVFEKNLTTIGTES